MFKNSKSQNLEDVSKLFRKETYSIKNNVKVSGGIGLNTMSYQSWDIASRNQPFNYTVNGNVNLELYKFSLPFTFSFTNRELNYSTPSIPINIVNITPTYKWAKAYIGIVNMNFSPYTLASHTFTGAGLELKPKNFRISLMGGRLLKKTMRDSVNINGTSSYNRLGFGAKFGMDHSFISGDLILFKAFDIYDSMVQKSSTEITPQDNFTAELILKKKIGKSIVVDFDYAVSGLTRNTKSSVNENSGALFINSNQSTQTFGALNMGITYTNPIFGLGIKYERIDPDYKTLGGYFFNNDIQNYTILPSFRTKNGKISINGNVGLQSDNLNDKKIKTTIRRIGSLDVSYAHSDRIIFSGQYSNFSSYTNKRTQLDPYFYNVADTMNFYQISQNMNLNNNLVLGQDKNQFINSTLGFQQSSDAASVEDNTVNVLTVNSAYGRKFARQNITCNLGINYYNTSSTNLSIKSYGPAFSVTKLFSKSKINTNAAISYNITDNNVNTGSILNCRLGCSYAPKLTFKDKNGQQNKMGNHSLALNAMYLKNFNEAVVLQNFSELTINCTYNIGF